MIEIFNTSINLHTVKESDITIDECFNELYSSASIVKKLTQQDQTWYLTGHSRKEASKYIVFNGNRLSQNAMDFFDRNHKRNFPLVNESIWNGQSDGLACAISHFMKFIDNPRKLNLIIELDQRVSSTADMIDSLLLLSEGKNNLWIKVDSKGYWLQDTECIS